jgi:hypothetical protein
MVRLIAFGYALLPQVPTVASTATVRGGAAASTGFDNSDHDHRDFPSRCGLTDFFHPPGSCRIAGNHDRFDRRFIKLWCSSFRVRPIPAAQQEGCIL